jgi:lipopolysaccharide export system permease protein
MIIRRYLLHEIVMAFSATLLVLLLIIIGNTFVRLLGKVSAGNLPLDVLSQLVLLGSVNGAIQLVPIALLIGMMLAFGRLSQDHEMSALNAAGIGPKEFYKGIFLFVAPLSLVLAGLVLFVVPWVSEVNQSVRDNVKQRPESSGIPVGEFMHTKKGDREFTIFVEALDEDQVVMEHFFMHTKQEGRESVILAEGAILFLDQNSGERVLQIRNGSRYDHKIDTGEFGIFRFAEHGIRVPALKVKSSVNLDAEPIQKLLQNPTPESRAELHWRIAIILSTPIMAFLAFPLSHSTPRQGRFGKLALGILIYAVYANLLISGKSMIEQEKVPEWLGLWWVHAIFLCLGAWLLWKYYGSRRQKHP